jgi:hypothetical protein
LPPSADRTATVSACSLIVLALWTVAVALDCPFGAADTDRESTTTPGVAASA